MTENQFDELFRNKLQDYSSQVPDNMWERIHPGKDRDRKLFFIWLKYVIVPVFTLAGLAGGYYIGSRPATHHSLSHAPVSGSSRIASVRNPVTYSHSSSASGNREVPGAYASASTVNTQISAIPPTVSVRAIQHTRKTSSTIRLSAIADPSDPLSAPASGHSSNPRVTPDADNALKRHPLPGIQPIPHTRFQPVIAQLPKTTSSAAKKTIPPAPKNPLSSLKKGSWSVDLYASPDLPVLRFKQDFEKAQLSFTIGVKVNRSFGDHVTAATGVQYSQVNEKVTYNDSGTTNPIRTAYLKRTSFDFPLLIGYGIGNDRFRATLNAGMIFKIHSSGNLYTASNSIYLGVNLAKKVNERISFFAEPYYRYNLPGGGNSQYYIRRINLAGVSVGLKYNFKKSGRPKIYDTNN